MICSLEKICNKEVIDVLTGERLGYIDDAEINLDTSEIVALIIYGREKFFGLLGKEEDVVIPCSEIAVVGSDVLLVKLSEKTKMTGITNKRRISLESLLK